jgi:hypothetical protein
LLASTNFSDVRVLDNFYLHFVKPVEVLKKRQALNLFGYLRLYETAGAITIHGLHLQLLRFREGLVLLFILMIAFVSKCCVSNVACFFKKNSGTKIHPEPTHVYIFLFLLHFSNWLSVGGICNAKYLPQF